MTEIVVRKCDDRVKLPVLCSKLSSRFHHTIFILRIIYSLVIWHWFVLDKAGKISCSRLITAEKTKLSLSTSIICLFMVLSFIRSPSSLSWSCRLVSRLRLHCCLAAILKCLNGFYIEASLITRAPSSLLLPTRLTAPSYYTEYEDDRPLFSLPENTSCVC